MNRRRSRPDRREYRLTEAGSAELDTWLRSPAPTELPREALPAQVYFAGRADLVASLPDHHSLIPDLPGFGASNAEPWTSVAEVADSAAAIIRDRAHSLACHSGVAGRGARGSRRPGRRGGHGGHAERDAVQGQAGQHRTEGVELLVGRVRMHGSGLAGDHLERGGAHLAHESGQLGISRGTPIRLFDLLRGTHWTLLGFGAGTAATLADLHHADLRSCLVVGPARQAPATV